MSAPQATASLEERVRALEDRLAIIDIIASHPPAADSGDDAYYRDVFTPEGTMDVGGGKAASGNAAIAAMVTTNQHRAAIAGGLCHFAGLPHVTVDGDRAVAVSYLQIVTPNRDAAPVEVPGHGASAGFRIHRAGVSRWDFVRTERGWKVARRSLRPLDGTPGAQDLLTSAR